MVAILVEWLIDIVDTFVHSTINQFLAMNHSDAMYAVKGSPSCSFLVECVPGNYESIVDTAEGFSEVVL